MDNRSGQLLLDALHRFSADWPAPWVLGFSGGLDSSVLLQGLMKAGLTASLTVVHVHHGQQTSAEDWARICEQRVQAMGFDCEIARITVTPGPDLENRLRDARRQALIARLPKRGTLLLAHHGDDQAETVLLRLLRGAGPHGLGGMTALSHWQERTIARPLLDWSRDDLAALAKAWDLSWIEDPSNQSLAHDRNFLRHRTLPDLQERWPGVIAVLGRTARRQRLTANLLDEISTMDLARLRTGPSSLSLGGFQALSQARRDNLLYGWLRARKMRAPSQRVLDRVNHELLSARVDSQPRIAWPEGVFCRFRDSLYLLAPSDLEPLCDEVNIELVEGLSLAVGHLRVDLEHREPHGWDQPGFLCVSPPQGVRMLTLGGVRRGDRILRNGMHRPLSELWRAGGMPPWERQRQPVLRHGDKVVAAGGIGVADGWGPSASDCDHWCLRYRLCSDAQGEQDR